MGKKVSAVALSFTLLLAAAGASAMTSAPPSHCRVSGGEKLLAEIGGVSAICGPIEKAVASAAPGARYEVEVSVLSRARLRARLVVDGRSLPEQNFAVMDAGLSAASIERFAQSLATEVAKAAKP